MQSRPGSLGQVENELQGTNIHSNSIEIWVVLSEVDTNLGPGDSFEGVQEGLTSWEVMLGLITWPAVPFN